MQNNTSPQNSYDRIAALKKADRGFSFQAVDSSNGHRLITHPDTFGVGSTDLQAASVKFGVRCEPRKSGLIVMQGKDDAIAAALEFAQQV